MASAHCMRFAERWQKRGTIMALLGPIVLSSCAAAPLLVPVAFEFARNLLQTSLQNYGSKHRDNVSNLVNRLASPYMQNLPPVAMGGPGMPGQPGVPGQPGMPPQQFPGQQTFPGQPGGVDPNNPYGASAGAGVYPGGAVGGFPGQPGVPQQQYPGQQTYPGQMGANSPYGAPGMTNPGASAYPGAVGGSPYGTVPGYQNQPGMNPYDPNNPYGSPTPYGQQANPYGAAGTNPYGGQNPYGSPNPYGTPNPYGGTGLPAQPGQANPYGSMNPYGGLPGSPAQPGYDPNNPYGTGGMGQGYGQTQPGYGTPSPYGAQPPQQAYNDPNNPYGTSGTPQAYGQAQPGFGAPSPYGTQQPQPAYGGYGAGGQPYGSQPYGGAGIYPRSVDPEPVAVDVAMVRQKQTAKGKEVVLMNDGEVLKDGGANVEAGDRFKIVVRANCDCYLYITGIDGSAWAEPIFPVKDSQTPNPVKKDQEYAFPEGPHWFSLDQVKGIETFYVVASANRRIDLEESMAALAAEKRPAVKIVAHVEEPPIIPRAVGSVGPRGIVKVQDDTGTTVQVTPLSYAANQSSQDVTVTRWFKHE